MAITKQLTGSSTPDASAGQTNHTIILPSTGIADGDVLLLQYVMPSGTTNTLSFSGLSVTQVGSNRISGHSHIGYTRTLAASDAGGSITITSTALKAAMNWSTWRGDDPNTPINAVQVYQGQSAGATTIPVNAATATVGGVVEVNMVAMTSSSAGATTFTPQAGSTIVKDVQSVTATTAGQAGGAIGHNTSVIAANGTGGGTTWTTDGTGTTSSITILLAPVAVAPTAAFSASPSGSSVVFTNTSTSGSGGTLTYAWAFGDGSTDTTAAPTHVYQSSGVKTVTLTVTDPNGLTATTSRQVTITATAALAGVVSITNAGSYTGSPDILTDITDGDPTTPALSPISPVNAALRVRVGGLTTPAAGTGLEIKADLDAINATTASAYFNVYEGTTLRGTIAAQNLPVVSATSAMGNTCTFLLPAAQLATFTSTGAIDLELVANAS